MRVYLDPSALLKRVIDEPGSQRLRAALRDHVDRRDLLVSSQLAAIEVSRALRNRFDLSYAQAAGLVDDAMSGIAEYPIEDNVLIVGRRLDPNRLRSLEAIHLASAILLDVDLLITYDDRMANAGHQNGLRCTAPSDEGR